ncbi:MAG: DNA-directed RNA polymerase subunit alpha C-terminal domain-containing protein, partial [Candidatus Latescibacteria bacterium]|nr:DNA-directed RNA polymerase subunit alpha C-terminal domain-containing protein [Candidatus Latescibacterota bacterium]
VVMELTVGNGRGYVFADENKSAEQPIGTIPMDSNFSPILKVNYNIENARVGRRTDYDKLTLEVWTDGSVGPEDAVAQAARVLIEHLGLIANLEDEPAQGSDEKEVDEETKRVARLLNTNVDELELTVRSANCLRAAGISTLKEMVQRTEAEMLKFRNFGRKSLKELGEILTTMDLAWGMDISRYEDVEVEEEPAGSLAEEF